MYRNIITEACDVMISKLNWTRSVSNCECTRRAMYYNRLRAHSDHMMIT